MVDQDREARRYRAFISYSQKDKRQAKRLHRALETYRVPSRVDAVLDTKRKLGRIFRDDDELGAADRLGKAIQDKLDDSENLIVMCSPNAAASRWVNEEVKYFKSRKYGARIFAVIVGGEPNAEQSEQECFPPTLRSEVKSDAAVTDWPDDQPLAPDLRKEAFAKVLTRLVAGILGIDFDTLWQRERRRRRVRATGIGGLALLVAGIGLGTLLFTLGQQTRAQVAEAERLAGLAQNQVADGDLLGAVRNLADAEKLALTPTTYAARLFFEKPPLTYGARLSIPDTTIRDIEFSEDSRILAAATNRGLAAWTLGLEDMPSFLQPRAYSIEPSGVSRLRIPVSNTFLVALDGQKAAASGDSPEPEGRVQVYRESTSGELISAPLYEYRGEALGFSRSGQYLLTLDPVRGQATVGRVDSTGTRAFVTSESQLYGQTIAAGGRSRRPIGNLVIAPELGPAQVAFNGFAGKESHVYIATGSHDPDQERNNMRAVAMMSLSWPANIYSGETVTWLPGHKGPVTAVALGPDDQMLVTGSNDSTVILWRLQNFERFTNEQTFNNGVPVSAVAVHLSGSAIASGGTDGSLRLWSIEGELLQRVPESGESISHLEFSPDGRYLAAVHDLAISIWRVNLDRFRQPDLLHQKPTRCLVFLPAIQGLGAFDASGALQVYTDNGAYLRGSFVFSDTQRRVLEKVGLKGAGIRDVQECVGARNSATVYTSYRSGQLVRRSAVDGSLEASVVAIPELESSPATSLATCTDDDCLCAGSPEWGVRLYDPRTLQLRESFEFSLSLALVELDDKCRRALVLSDRGALQLLDLHTGSRRDISATAAGISIARFSADGTQAAAASADGTLHVFDTIKARQIIAIPVAKGRKITALAMPSSDLVLLAYDRAAAGTTTLTLEAWDTQKRKIIKSINLPTDYTVINELELHPNEAELAAILGRRGVAFEGDGQLLVAGNSTLAELADSTVMTSTGVAQFVPDPAAADFWRAYWRARRHVDELAAYVAESGDRLAVRSSVPVFNDLAAWVEENPDHSFSYEAKSRLEFLRARAFSLSAGK